MVKQKWIYWSQIVRSEHPKYKEGEILGLNRRETRIHIQDDSDQNDFIGKEVVFKFIGRLPKTDDINKNYTELINLCAKEKVEITEEMKKFAKKNNISVGVE